MNRVDWRVPYGVVPARWDPSGSMSRRPQGTAVAARTYALAHRGQFEAEGYDLCATPKCQVYSGAGVGIPRAMRPSSDRGLVSPPAGVSPTPLLSTCGGVGKRREVFGETAFVSDVGRLRRARDDADRGCLGSRRKSPPRTPLEWRGYVLARHAPERRASRPRCSRPLNAAGLPLKGGPFLSRSRGVYPSVFAAFGLETARSTHLLPATWLLLSLFGRGGAPSRRARGLRVLVRFVSAREDPPRSRASRRKRLRGTPLLGVLRLPGVTEGSVDSLRGKIQPLGEVSGGRSASRPTRHAARAPDRGSSSPTGALPSRRRSARWWKRGPNTSRSGWKGRPSVPRSSGTLPGRMGPARFGPRAGPAGCGRIAGEEVRRSSPPAQSAEGGRDPRAATQPGTFRRFDLRQAPSFRDALTVERGVGPRGQTEFLFPDAAGATAWASARTAFGMASQGQPTTRSPHYYSGIEIVPPPP